MKKNYIYALIIFLICNSAIAQTTSLRGLYIDHFSSILGNSTKEDSLLHYAQDSSFNYMAFYDLQSLNLHDATTANKVGAFLKRAKEQFGVQYTGAVCENYLSFQNDIAPYNSNRGDDNERFNVFNLEFEFWTSSSVNSGGYYCTRYLQGANCSCDTSGGFKFFINQMHMIDSLAHVQQVISETYLGWFNQGQGAQIQQNVDRILLHAYRTNTSSLFSYSKTRMQYLASNNTPVDIAPIFSSEPSFMGPWLETHSQLEAYTQYKNDFDNDNSSWKQYINILGYQWFDWKYMPRPVPGTFNPVITASGPITFCTGESVTLTATSGDTYQWSNGATTRTIVVTNSGNYSCYVTLNGITNSTPTTAVSVKNIPAVTISSGNMVAGQVPLTANATPGSGTISGYQWKLNNADVPGATSSAFTSVITGGYTVDVTNSFGCSTVSSVQNVTITGASCNASTPTGLSSAAISELSYSLHWTQGQSGDSIIVRFRSDTTTNNYYYVRMLNIGQCELLLNNLQSSTTYGWSVFTVCGSSQGTFSAEEYFTTGVSTGIHPIPHIKNPNENGSYENMLSIYPNPARYETQVNYYTLNSGKGEIKLMDVNSRIVFSETVHLETGENKLLLNTSDYGNGIYFLSFKSDETVLVKKIIISH